MNKAEMVLLARANVDAHLGDCADPDDPGSIWENAYILASDALIDAGVSNKVANEIAEELAYELAPPENSDRS